MIYDLAERKRWKISQVASGTSIERLDPAGLFAA